MLDKLNKTAQGKIIILSLSSEMLLLKISKFLNFKKMRKKVNKKKTCEV